MRNERLTRITVRILIVLLPLLLFEVLVRMRILDPFTFIPFTEMIRTMGKLLMTQQFVSDSIIPTAGEAMASFISAAVIGILFGIVLWRSDSLYHTVQPYLMLFYAVPVFAIYPVFISLFGTGPLPVIIVGFLFAVVTVITNTAIGFRETKNVFIKVGKSLNLNFRQMLFHVYIPAAWPYIFTGLKLALAYSIIGVVATEFILSTRGLGHSIAFAYNNFDLKGMYGGILLVIAIILVVNTILGYFESALYNRNMKGH
ncbi:ABC transporter permease [Effusibacillus dendaii]|uniref:ABC transmembrane type-1 domain-containing protein n=1 Tax=Effusibacillus dendaii TaxID=2743772 RepID=A0A7I8DBD4_9BACL|nr:ABC transporter permease subunit [Effusibacillus dendaii]BCJ86146.1 hypothetical protein skT53_11310 [Effusibacillus dendaii]